MWYRQVGDAAQGVGGMAMKYLLRGDTGPLKMSYWDFAATLRIWARDRRELPRVLAKLRSIKGAVLYCFA